jgi:hypothetical protein
MDTSIAVDCAGNAHVAGWTTSTDFPASSPIQAQPKSSVDAFVANLVRQFVSAGDWSSSGVSKAGVFLNGTWFLDTNGEGSSDQAAYFGQAGGIRWSETGRFR